MADLNRVLEPVPVNHFSFCCSPAVANAPTGCLETASPVCCLCIPGCLVADEPSLLSALLSTRQTPGLRSGRAVFKCLNGVCDNHHFLPSDACLNSPCSSDL